MLDRDLGRIARWWTAPPRSDTVEDPTAWALHNAGCMSPIRRRSVPAHIEETIGRRLLFRESPAENEPVESIESLMEQFEASKPTAREGMQRLLATGLVVAGRGHSFVSPPLHYARGMEALELEIRCADTPERRRRAFVGWLECLHHVTRHALRDAMGRRSDDVRLLKDEFERLTGVGYSRSSSSPIL